MREINLLKEEIDDILKDFSEKVLASPHVLNQVPLALSLELEDYLNAFVSLSEEEKDSELGQSLAKIFIEAQGIAEKYNTATTVFSQIKEKLQEDETFNVSEDELDLVRENLLSKRLCADDLFTKGDKLYATICKYFAHNASVNSGLFQDGEIIKVEELEEVDPKVAYHAKKTAFDQVCASVFNRYPDQYDKGYHVEYIGDDHPLNSLMGKQSINKNELAIAFVNMKKMNHIEPPKFGELLDPISGKSLKIKDIEQEKTILKVPCNVVGKNVIIEVAMYKGIAIAQRG